MHCYVMTQIILALWLVPTYDLLEGNGLDDVIYIPFCVFII